MAARKKSAKNSVGGEVSAVVKWIKGAPEEDREALELAARESAERDAIANGESFFDRIGDTPPENETFTERLKRHGQVLEPGQLVLAKVLFDQVDPIDLEGDEKIIALKMFGCERIPATSRIAGMILAVCGGRGGKSLLAAWRLVDLAVTVELKLSPGEQAFAIIVAPDKDLAAQVLRYCEGIALEWYPDNGRPPAECNVIEKSTLGFTFVRPSDGERVRFMVTAASKGGASQRGRVLVGAVLDEAAFFKGEDSVINDKEIIKAISPRVAKGGELIIITTPQAKIGEVWEIYEQNFGHPVDAVVAHAPTWVLRTDEKILFQVAREKAKDEANYNREFGAEFMSKGSSAFFNVDDLTACIQGEKPVEMVA